MSTTQETPSTEISQEDRQALAEAALHGDMAAVRGAIAKVMGKMSSPRKAASSRANGRKGGRPRKTQESTEAAE